MAVTLRTRKPVESELEDAIRLVCRELDATVVASNLRREAA